MAKKRHPSLGQRLTRMSVVASSVALILACSAFLIYEYITFRSALVRSLETQAAITATNSESAILFNDAASATETLAALRAEPHIVSIHIFKPDGELFASYVRAGEPPGAPPSVAPDAPEGPRFAPDRLIVTRRVLSERAPIGTLVVAADLDEMAARFQRYAGIVVGVIVCSLLTGLLLASRLQRRITRPILALVEAARTVSAAKTYSIRVDSGDDDELGTLAGTFNEMLAQIEARDRELRLARDELEARVDERTEALKQEIGERVRLEEQLRHRNQELTNQNRRVQEANRLKSEFLANMSHELRTPLNAIIGFSELLVDGKVGPTTPKQKEFLNDVLVSSRHLLKLINDVLDLSKVEAGKMEFRPEPVDLAVLVNEVSDSLRALAATKHLEVTTAIDATVQTVLVDRSKLKQVLYNYASNAIKFTGDGGTIAIRVKPESTDEFRVEVTDSGVGIRQEDLRHLFVEFQQLDSTTGKRYAGTGLGLALTKRILEAQGGRYGVDSVPGQGSTFFAVLPKTSRGVVRRDSIPAAAVVATDRPLALVIEDEDADRRWVQKVLEQAGYSVVTARNGKEALARVKERSFDRITLDLLLNDISGWEVLRTIRHESLNQETPVIITTVLAEQQLGMGFAIQDYLVKPLRADELMQSLSQASVSKTGDREILVVDDNPQALKLMEDALAHLGYRSILERSGRSGLLAVANRRPAAVILDLMMPEMDGFQFLAELRKTEVGKDLPVIIWTMKDVGGDDRARLLATAQAVVPKGAGSLPQLVRELENHAPRVAPKRGGLRGE